MNNFKIKLIFLLVTVFNIVSCGNHTDTVKDNNNSAQTQKDNAKQAHDELSREIHR